MENRNKYVSFYYEHDLNSLNKEISIDPEKTALLIIDMQNEFILRDSDEAKAFKEMGIWEKWVPFHDRLDNIVIPNNKKLLKFFREKNLEVTFGRIACYHNDGRDRCLVQKRPGWNDICLPLSSHGAAIIDELKPLEDEIVVDKTTDSVVSGTNYAKLLRNMGIETVVATGIVTDQCVASTVRDLADEGFNVIVVEDCCAAGSQEGHDSELKTMNIIYCNVMNTNEVIELINKNFK